MSIREQREVIKQRVIEVRKLQDIKRQSRSPTRPVDTSTNKRLFIKQQERMRNLSMMTGGTILNTD